MTSAPEGPRWLEEDHLPRVAIHEAGHAVMHESLGNPVRSIGMSRVEGLAFFTGSCSPGVPLWDERTRALFWIAGRLAEAILRGATLEPFLRSFREEMYPEHEEAEDEIGGDAHCLRALLEDSSVDLVTVGREADAILRARWPAVEAVAAALLEKRKTEADRPSLDGSEVRAAMAMAMPVAKAEGPPG